MPEEKKEKKAARGTGAVVTPVNVLWQGVLLIPIHNTLDSQRAQELMDSMLREIVKTGAKSVILDILGVGAVDTAVANHLVKLTKATRLMGCECIISGISPVVAQTIVQLGVDLGNVITTATLKDALELAFDRMGLEVREAPKKKGA